MKQKAMGSTGSLGNVLVVIILVSSFLVVKSLHTKLNLKMGGHALKKVIASRMSPLRYANTKKIVAAKLAPYIHIGFSPELPGKTSFGDVDVLFYADSAQSEQLAALQKGFKGKMNPISALILIVFNSPDIVVNGDVISFAFEHKPCVEDGDDALEDGSESTCASVSTGSGALQYHQVDLIKCSDEQHLNWMQFYLSYADLGGIIGGMTSRRGIKFGQDGLYVQVSTNALADFQRKQRQLNSSPPAAEDEWTVQTVSAQESRHSNEGE